MGSSQTQFLHVSSWQTVKEWAFLLGEAVGLGKVRGNPSSLYGFPMRQDKNGSATEDVDRQIWSCPRACANVFQMLFWGWGTIQRQPVMARHSRMMT